ncbi:MAG: hypothetical protein WAU03_01695 [Candidatus Saccharimonas aalborgensis]
MKASRAIDILIAGIAVVIAAYFIFALLSLQVSQIQAPHDETLRTIHGAGLFASLLLAIVAFYRLSRGSDR